MRVWGAQRIRRRLFKSDEQAVGPHCAGPFSNEPPSACWPTGAGLGGYAWLIEPHWVEVVRRDLPIRFLPDVLDGKTLVQISDLHIGPEVSDAYLRDRFHTVARDRPRHPRRHRRFHDLSSPTRSWITSAASLDDLRPGRLATLGILGNHDYAQ